MKINLHRLRAEEEEIPFVDSKQSIFTGRDLRRVMPFHNYFGCLELECSTFGFRRTLKGEKNIKAEG